MTEPLAVGLALLGAIAAAVVVLLRRLRTPPPLPRIETPVPEAIRHGREVEQVEQLTREEAEAIAAVEALHEKSPEERTAAVVDWLRRDRRG